MNSAPGRYLLLLATSLPIGHLVAQPLCDVLIRPAFHYTTNGLAVVASDSSRTYGLTTQAYWSFGEGTALSSTPDHEFSQPGTYPVCLTLTTTDGALCSSTYCRDVVVPMDTCDGGAAAWFSHHGSGTNANLFTAGSTDPGNGSWLWEFGDGTTSTDPAPGHTWALPGPHFVSLTRQMAGCTSTYGRWVEVDGNGTTCGPGLFADFVPQFNGPLTTFTPSLVSTGITPMLGIWSYGDGTIDTAMVGSHVYEEAWGSYQVCMLVGALAQASLDTCFSLVCRTIDLYSMAGVGEVSRMALGAWPNPADGVVHLRWPGPSTQATIRWYDMLGRPVKEWTQVLEPTTTLRSDDLPDGLYVLEVIAAQERYTQRLRIAH